MTFDNYINVSFDKIIKILNNAIKSPYWKTKFKLKSITDIDSFRSIPIRTREEINNIYDNGRKQKLLTTKKNKNLILLTSGGRPYRSPFLTYLSKEEFLRMSNVIMSLFKQNCLKSEKILITFPGVLPYPKDFAFKVRPRKDLPEYKSAHISGRLFKNASVLFNLKTYCTGLRFLAYKVSASEAELEKKRIFSAYSYLKPDILAVSPNILRNIFFPELKKSNKNFLDYNTKLIICGGAKLFKEDYERIYCFGNPKIVIWIESGEIGTLGYSKSFYAPQFDDLFFYSTWQDNFFETIDNFGQPLEFGLKGRIVVTRLYTFVQPLIRYDLEDEGQFFCNDNEILLTKNIAKL